MPPRVNIHIMIADQFQQKLYFNIIYPGRIDDGLFFKNFIFPSNENRFFISNLKKI